MTDYKIIRVCLSVCRHCYGRNFYTILMKFCIDVGVPKSKNDGRCWAPIGCLCNANFDWGSEPQISPFRVRPGTLCNTVLLWATRVSLSDGISYPPNGFSRVHECNRRRDRHTDGPRAVAVTSVAIGGIAEYYTSGAWLQENLTIILRCDNNLR